MARPTHEFWYRLAALMHTSVRECQERVDSREFSGWQAYWELNPFGTEIQMLAKLCMLIYNANIGPKQKPLSAEDMLPVKPPERPRLLQESSDTKANLRAALAGLS